MAANQFRFGFQSAIPLTEAELTLHLAIYATEGVHGESCVRLEVIYDLDRSQNAIVVDSQGEAGMTLARIFTHLLSRQFGEDGFEVRRIAAMQTSASVSDTKKQPEEAATAAA